MKALFREAVLRDSELFCADIQVSDTILESVKWDNYPRYVLTTDRLIQKRNGILHENLMEFMMENRNF